MIDRSTITSLYPIIPQSNDWPFGIGYTVYTISLSAKNSNCVKSKVIKQCRWLYAPLGQWDKHCVFFLLFSY